MKKSNLYMALLCLFANKLSYSQDWSLSGNTGTNHFIHFVGTTDNQQLILKTNGLTRMSIGTSNGVINPGAVTIGNLDPDAAPYYGGLLRLRSPFNETAIDLIKATNTTTGWDNQIRFYNTNNLRHVIADDFATGKLVIQTNVDPASGSVDILDIRGRVQIGQGPSTFTTPAGYNLYVANGILSEKVKVALKTTGDWADHVFQKDYTLLSIDELKSYITRHKHLPGIPSAQEMVTNGNDLGQTDARLLEKIEELSLYIIHLNDENKKLKAELGAIVPSNPTSQQFQSLSETILVLKKEIDLLRKAQSSTKQ